MLKEPVQNYLKTLRETIIQSFESVENSTFKFCRTPWCYAKGSGGGEIAVLRGSYFEKAAVNFSAIEGETFPGDDGKGPFFATGISLITHMANPHSPTVHMNLRYIVTKDNAWFGGGYDLTPMGFPYEEDTHHFHSIAKQTLDKFGPEIYDQFSKQAKHYFYIPHRKKERGVGGIFFDHLHSGDQQRDFSLWKEIGNTFLDAITPIYKKRKDSPFSSEERELQLKTRAHYVEFNLLYDRGTKFGFLSGGNPDAILCSMPPLVKW